MYSYFLEGLSPQCIAIIYILSLLYLVYHDNRHERNHTVKSTSQYVQDFQL